MSFDPKEVADEVANVDYYLFPGTRTTVCRVETKNGWAFVGTASCASMTKFDAAAGRGYAYNEAMAQVRKAEGYARAKARKQPT